MRRSGSKVTGTDCVPEAHSASRTRDQRPILRPDGRAWRVVPAIVRVADDLVTIVSKADRRGEVVHYPDDRQGRDVRG